MIDKQKHVNEFRLRILLTNQCNRNCGHCLNDFQHKGEDYISLQFVKDFVSVYTWFCEEKGITPIISLSGGEPGLHPEIGSIIHAIEKTRTAKLQINTNGLLDKVLPPSVLRGLDIRYHIGPTLYNNKVPGQTAVWVLGDGDNAIHMIHGMMPYFKAGMKLKTFVDYYATRQYREDTYSKVLSEINKKIPVSGRHTGIQINRGPGCNGCRKVCVTLKALWLFPNNTSSFCPQRLGTNKGPIQAIEEAYHSHHVHS